MPIIIPRDKDEFSARLFMPTPGPKDTDPLDTLAAVDKIAASPVVGMGVQGLAMLGRKAWNGVKSLPPSGEATFGAGSGPTVDPAQAAAEAVDSVQAPSSREYDWNQKAPVDGSRPGLSLSDGKKLSDEIEVPQARFGGTTPISRRTVKVQPAEMDLYGAQPSEGKPVGKYQPPAYTKHVTRGGHLLALDMPPSATGEPIDRAAEARTALEEPAPATRTAPFKPSLARTGGVSPGPGVKRDLTVYPESEPQPVERRPADVAPAERPVSVTPPKLAEYGKLPEATPQKPGFDAERPEGPPTAEDRAKADAGAIPPGGPAEAAPPQPPVEQARDAQAVTAKASTEAHRGNIPAEAQAEARLLERMAPNPETRQTGIVTRQKELNAGFTPSDEAKQRQAESDKREAARIAFQQERLDEAAAERAPINFKFEQRPYTYSELENLARRARNPADQAAVRQAIENLDEPNAEDYRGLSLLEMFTGAPERAARAKLKGLMAVAPPRRDAEAREKDRAASEKMYAETREVEKTAEANRNLKTVSGNVASSKGAVGEAVAPSVMDRNEGAAYHSIAEIQVQRDKIAARARRGGGMGSSVKPLIDLEKQQLNDADNDKKKAQDSLTKAMDAEGVGRDLQVEFARASKWKDDQATRLADAERSFAKAKNDKERSVLEKNLDSVRDDARAAARAVQDAGTKIAVQTGRGSGTVAAQDALDKAETRVGTHRKNVLMLSIPGDPRNDYYKTYLPEYMGGGKKRVAPPPPTAGDVKPPTSHKGEGESIRRQGKI